MTPDIQSLLLVQDSTQAPTPVVIPQSYFSAKIKYTMKKMVVVMLKWLGFYCPLSVIKYLYYYFTTCNFKPNLWQGPHYKSLTFIIRGILKVI